MQIEVAILLVVAGVLALVVTAIGLLLIRLVVIAALDLLRGATWQLALLPPTTKHPA